MPRANPNNAPNQLQSSRAEPPSTLGNGGVPPIAGAPMPAAMSHLGSQLEDGRTYVQSMGNTEPQYFNAEALPSGDGVINPPARPQRDYTSGPRDEPPPVDRYVVMQDFLNSSPRFPRGKVLDSLNYDVKRIASMGVKLRCLTKDSEGKRLETPLDAGDVLLTN